MQVENVAIKVEEIKPEPPEEFIEIIPDCDRQCRVELKACGYCKIYKAQGSVENLPAYSKDQYFSVTFSINGLPYSTTMVQIKKNTSDSRLCHIWGIKVIESDIPVIQPRNQIVVTFQVKKNLVVTSPSALAETFLCLIPEEQENCSRNKIPEKIPSNPQFIQPIDTTAVPLEEEQQL